MEGQNLTDTEPLYTRQEAAERLKVSLATVDRLLSNGKLQCYKVNKRSIIGETHIQALLKASERKAEIED